MLRHGLDIIPNLQDGGQCRSEAVILNDFEARAKLVKTSTLHSGTYLYTLSMGVSPRPRYR